MLALVFLAFVALSVSGAMAQGSAGSQPHRAGGAQLKFHLPLLTRDDLIADALSAAPPKIAFGAAVRNWDGTPVRQGNEEYVCFPTPTEKLERGERAPVCLDEVVRAWSEAWMNNEPFKAERVGIAYALSAEASASSVDPYAWTPASDKHWVAEGPHILLIFPDPAQLNTFPDDPKRGGPFVRWRDTPYAHLIIPVERSVLGR